MTKDKVVLKEKQEPKLDPTSVSNLQFMLYTLKRQICLYHGDAISKIHTKGNFKGQTTFLKL